MLTYLLVCSCFGLVLEVDVENSSASSPAEIHVRAVCRVDSLRAWRDNTVSWNPTGRTSILASFEFLACMRARSRRGHDGVGLLDLLGWRDGESVKTDSANAVSVSQ